MQGPVTAPAVLTGKQRWTAVSNKVRMAIKMSTTNTNKRHLRDEVVWPLGVPAMASDVVTAADKFDNTFSSASSKAESMYWRLDRIPEHGSNVPLPLVYGAFDKALFGVTSARCACPGLEQGEGCNPVGHAQAPYALLTLLRLMWIRAQTSHLHPRTRR